MKRKRKRPVTSKTPSLKALREKAGELLTKMTSLRDKYKQSRADNKADEATAAKAEFERTREEFDEVQMEIDEEHRKMDVGLRRRRGDRGPTKREQPGLWFRDLKTGRDFRALEPSEPLSELRRILDDPDSDDDDDDERSKLRVGECLRAVVTGQVDRLESHERRALLSGVDSAGGYLLNPTLGSAVLDLARSAAVCMKAGARTIPLNSPEMHLARLTSDPTSQWRAEGTTITGSEVTFGRVVMRPRTLACIVPLPIELMEDADNVGDILQGAMQRSMGLKLDQAALLGSGAVQEPQGLATLDGTNSVSMGGAPTSYAKYSEAVGEILQQNFDGDPSMLSWINNPRDEGALDVLEDDNGNPLQLTPWVAALKRFRTSSLAATSAYSFIGHFPQMVFGMRTRGVVIRVLDSGTVTDEDGVEHNAATQLKKLLVAYLRADVAVLQPSWFTVIDGITA